MCVSLFCSSRNPKWTKLQLFCPLSHWGDKTHSSTSAGETTESLCALIRTHWDSSASSLSHENRLRKINHSRRRRRRRFVTADVLLRHWSGFRSRGQESADVLEDERWKVRSSRGVPGQDWERRGWTLSHQWVSSSPRAWCPQLSALKVISMVWTVMVLFSKGAGGSFTQVWHFPKCHLVYISPLSKSWPTSASVHIGTVICLRCCHTWQICSTSPLYILSSVSICLLWRSDDDVVFHLFPLIILQSHMNPLRTPVCSSQQSPSQRLQILTGDEKCQVFFHFRTEKPNKDVKKDGDGI